MIGTFVIIMGIAFAGVVRPTLPTCHGTTPAQTAAISIGFEYSNWDQPLQLTKSDAAFYHNQMGKSLSDSPRLIGDAELAGQSKADFLNLLRRQVAGKDTVFFGYAGHGGLFDGKSWSMILPSMPNELKEKCWVQMNQKTKAATRGVVAKTPTNECAAVNQYLVSDRELREVFGQRKVVVFNDSCHSGGADFGPHASTISAAAADQTADEVPNAGHARFTARMKERLSECQYDANKDGQLSGSEFTTKFAFAPPGQRAKAIRPQPKTMSIARRYQPIPSNLGSTRHNPEPYQESTQRATMSASPAWLSCLNFGSTGASCNGANPANPNAIPAEVQDHVR